MVQLAYWRSGMLVGNLGDSLSPWLAHRLGVDWKHYRPTTNEQTVLFGVGSIIDDFWLAPLMSSPGRRGVVWGSGTRGGELAVGRERLDVIAVRGPVTARHLGVGADVVLGDPGLLVASLWPSAPPERTAGRVLWVRHFDTNRSSARDLAMLGCTEQLSTRVLSPVHQWRPRPGAPLKRLSPYRMRVEARRLRDDPVGFVPSSIPTTLTRAIESIATAEFVLTDSLHGAVIAQSFGVPWAAHARARDRVPARWADLFGSFGVEPEFTANAVQGAAWHRRVSNQLDSFSVEALLASVADLRAALVA